MKSLTFLLFCSCLPGFKGHIILEQVHDIDVRPISNSFEQAEESRCHVVRKEGFQAIKHHALVAVTQLRIKLKRNSFSSQLWHTRGSQPVSKCPLSADVKGHQPSLCPAHRPRQALIFPHVLPPWGICSFPQGSLRAARGSSESRYRPPLQTASLPVSPEQERSICPHPTPPHVPGAFRRGWPPASPRAARSSDSPALPLCCHRCSAIAAQGRREGEGGDEKWRSPAMLNATSKPNHLGNP